MSADHFMMQAEKKRADMSVQTISKTGHFTGYASLFDISDLSNDIVKKGAFQTSLNSAAERPIRMLFQHDPDQPIGRWTKLIEDQKGLYVEGYLTLDVARAKEVHSLMLSKALDGLSIGFKTTKSSKDKATGARHILEADLWEISIVTFPMLPSARIKTVKSNKRNPLPFDDQMADIFRQAAHWI